MFCAFKHNHPPTHPTPITTTTIAAPKRKNINDAFWPDKYYSLFNILQEQRTRWIFRIK